MKATYNVAPSDRFKVEPGSLPFTVVRNDGSHIASFHSGVYAMDFARSMNEAAESPGSVKWTDKLCADVRDIHPNLFLLRSRNGNIFFASYHTNALPTVQEVTFLFFRGYGNCKLLDGGALPREGMHALDNGWGLVVVPYRGRDHGFEQELDAAAWQLLMECAKRAVILSYPERFFFNLRERIYRLRRKWVAFRAT